MKVLINAISAKMGGFKILVNSFIANIDENDFNEYYFLAYTGAIDKELFHKKNIHILETNIGDMNHLKRFFWYQVKLPKIIKENKYEYMINLTNYGPTFPKCKQILLLHNSKHVSKEIYDSYNWKNKLKLIIEDMILKMSLKGSCKLVLQTNYMKEGVIRKFKYPEERIVIIPNSPTEIKIDNINNELEKKLVDFIGKEKNVLANITLYSKHKNLELLLDAFKYIKDNNLEKVKLIITVDKNENEDANNLINMINEYEIEDYVFSVGNVKHENIHQILSKAKIFVFPSYAESLGLPYIEAMRFGLPIVAADLGFANDVCGDSALYFKYDDSKELAQKIVYLLTNNKQRLEMVCLSKERGLLFNEQDIVKKYIELLK